MLKELEPIAAKLNEACAMMTRTLDQLSEDQATTLMVTPDWSVKDAIAHLVGAKRGMTRMAQRFAAGEDPQLPEDYNNDYYNARQVAKRKAMSFGNLTRIIVIVVMRVRLPNAKQCRLPRCARNSMRRTKSCWRFWNV